MRLNRKFAASLALFGGAVGCLATIITFSEFPVNTPISNQYADRGVLFSGDSPFITTDTANPTSPVLSGTPRFFGRLSSFVVRTSDPHAPTVARKLSFDAGYFDSIGSVRVEWFDKDGNKLGQLANTKIGIEHFEIEDAGGIASMSIGIFADEPAGYGIDNFDLELVGPSVLFREKKEDVDEGFWFLLGDEVPGWDHCGFSVANLVYESYPGYHAGVYVSADGKEEKSLTEDIGVQAQHTVETFKHDALKRQRSRIIDRAEIPIDPVLADKMKTFAEAHFDAGFRLLDFRFPAGIQATLSPFAQKGGGDNQFTCVGLVEASAEAAGHNGGQGFIPNRFESFTVPGQGDFPLFSPELLYYSMRGQQAINSATQWIQGWLDPVDFIITDPVGRRLGFMKPLGLVNEIPGAFYSGDAFFEQFLIPNPIPGAYTIEVRDKGKVTTSKSVVGLSTADQTMRLALPTAAAAAGLAAVASEQISVAAKTGVPGDVDRNGVVNMADLTLLRAAPKAFVNGPGDPRDITGDGIISFADVLALERLLTPPVDAGLFAGVVTTMKGVFTATVAGGKRVKGRDQLAIAFGATRWGGTDVLGNEMKGDWSPRNRSGTLVGLTLDDTTAALTQATQAARASLREANVAVALTAPPAISMVRTPAGRYKVSVKIKFTARGSSGRVRSGSFTSKLTL